MSDTTIKTNWDKKLQEGEEVQNKFKELLKTIYPDIQDYKDGKQKEADLEIPSLKILIEVKKDYKSDHTGNLAVEYLFRGKHSGILATKSDYYVMSDFKNYYIFKTRDLLDFLIMNKKYWAKVKGGDDNDAMMLLVPKGILTNRYFCCAINKENPDMKQVLDFM